MYYFFPGRFLFFFVLATLDEKDFCLLKKISVSNSVVISSNLLKYFVRFFGFCKNQVFLVLSDNVLDFCKNLEKEQFDKCKIMAISYNGYFLNTDLDSLIKTFHLNLLGIQIHVFSCIMQLGNRIMGIRNMLICIQKIKF